jgi:transposase
LENGFLAINNLVPRAVQVADKFHVMKYVYGAVGEVGKRIVKELQNSLTKGKRRTAEDQKLLVQIERLRRVAHALTQLADKWNSEMEETIEMVFNCHEELKKAYQISQDLKQWYDIGNRMKTTAQLIGNLHQGYLHAASIEEFMSVS